MKKLLLFVLFGLGALAARAQDSYPWNAGGFGHFFMGPSVFYHSELNDYLGKADVTGSKYNVRAGMMSGGEGAALLGRFIIGGGGYGQTSGNYNTDSAAVNFSAGGGYFKFGYVLYETYNHFCYAYGGAGWGSLNTEIENLSSEHYINFNHRAPIAPGFKASYTLGYSMYDLGLGYKAMFLNHEKKEGGKGGFMLGVDLGTHIMLPNNGWQSEKEGVVSGPPVTSAYLSPYLRVTIGGGGFSKRPDFQDNK